MYVNLEPYVGRLNPSNWYDRWIKLRYSENSWYIDHNKLDILDKVIYTICDYLQVVANKTINPWYFDKKQRKEIVKIHEYDAWNANHTIALVVLPLLQELKRQGCGIPYTDPEDVPHIGNGDSTFDGLDDTNAEARWEWVLNEMIYAFEAEVDECEWEDQFYKTNPRCLNKEEKKLYEEGIKRRKNGLILFGKYYHALWN